MTWPDALGTAWKGVRGHKVRTVLAMLGVIIGIAAVVLLVALGNGASETVTARIETLGTNLIFVSPTAGTPFYDSQVAYIQNNTPMAKQAVPVLDTSTQLATGTTTFAVPLVGTTPGYATLGSLHLAAGRFLTNADLRFDRHVIVLGANVSASLFAKGNPIGQAVAVLGQQFRVVGVLAPIGQGPGTSQDNEVFVPLSVAQTLLGTDSLSLVVVQTTSPQQAVLAANLLTHLYTNLYNNASAVTIASEDQVLAALNATRQTFTDLLAGTAAISLVVGGIGIMNIMLVSVAERTREIGVRCAVGATPEDIGLQFLLEAMGISFSGGLIGIGAGLSLLRAAAPLLRVPFVFTPSSLILAFAFSTSVGLAFGLYPALRASRLDPIVALQSPS